MEYAELNDEAKREIARGNLLQAESEHYALSLRLTAYDGAQDVTPENKAEMIRETRARIASLEAAIEVYRAELAQLGNGAAPSR